MNTHLSVTPSPIHNAGRACKHKRSCKSSHRIRKLPACIDRSGFYTFGHDFDWAPASDGAVAITINAIDVTIDLKGFYLKQVDRTKANCIAILVNSTGANITNIQIQNGTIRDMGMYAIVVLGSTEITNPLVSDISIHDVRFLFNGYNGSDIWTPLNSGVIGIFNADIHNNPASSPQNIVIERCALNDNYATSITNLYFAPILCYGSNNIIIRQCTFNGNNALFTEAAPNDSLYAIMVALFECTGAQFSQCVVSGTKLANLDYGGIFNTFFCTDVNAESIQVFNTTVTSSYLFASIGYLFSDSCSARNCVFQGLDYQVFGLFAECYGAIASTNIVFDHCDAQNVQGPLFNLAPIQVHADTDLDTGANVPSQHVQILHCTVQEVVNTSVAPFYPGETYFSAGISVYNILGLTPSSQDVLVQGCKVQNVTFPGGGGQTASLGAAIYAGNTSALVVQNNTIASCDNGILLLVQPEAGVGVLAGTVSDNRVANCPGIGFQDATGASVFIKNRGSFNGTGYQVATNIPVVQWNFSGGDAVPSSINVDVDNVNVY